MFAYDFPILGVFWSLLIFSLWVAFFIVLFRVITDIFRSNDLSGWAKALWLILVIFLPLVGSLIYLIARGRTMGMRDIEHKRAQEQELAEYIRTDVSRDSPADQLTKLADLQSRGMITMGEFEDQKAKIFSAGG